jgi:hypothetical protein
MIDLSSCPKCPICGKKHTSVYEARFVHYYPMAKQYPAIVAGIAATAMATGALCMKIRGERNYFLPFGWH